MSTARYAHALALVRRAQELAADAGVANILLPGRLKEMALADLLGHSVNVDKLGADALDADGGLIEYLTCLGEGSFKFDHLGQHNLYRITRNRAVYCAAFDVVRTLDPVYVWRVPVDALAAEAARRIAASGRREVTFAVSQAWVRRHGELVWQAPEQQPVPAAG